MKCQDSSPDSVLSDSSPSDCSLSGIFTAVTNQVIAAGIEIPKQEKRVSTVSAPTKIVYDRAQAPQCLRDPTLGVRHVNVHVQVLGSCGQMTKLNGDTPVENLDGSPLTLNVRKKLLCVSLS